MIHSNTFAALFDLDKLDRDIERALFSTFLISDQTFNTWGISHLWFLAPFYALRLLQLRTISVAVVTLHRHRRHGKEKDRTRLFYSSFSSIIEFRASVVSITRAFLNFPAAVLPYLWIRVGSRALFRFRLPLSCRIVNTSRLARFFSLIPRFCQEQKSVSFSHFSLCSENYRDSIPRIVDCLARVSNYGSRPI